MSSNEINRRKAVFFGLPNAPIRKGTLGGKCNRTACDRIALSGPHKDLPIGVGGARYCLQCTKDINTYAGQTLIAKPLTALQALRLIADCAEMIWLRDLLNDLIEDDLAYVADAPEADTKRVTLEPVNSRQLELL